MRIQLIMLPNQPILVSDEEIKEGFYKYCPFDDINKIHKQEGQYFDKHEYKIIAGIPELPSIDFSALPPKEHTKIGYTDIINLAIKNGCDFKDITGYSFIKGFKVAQSLNEKKFSEEDMKQMAYEIEGQILRGNCTIKESFEFHRDKIIQSLSQPKVFDVITNLSDDNKSYIITKII